MGMAQQSCASTEDCHVLWCHCASFVHSPCAHCCGMWRLSCFHVTLSLEPPFGGDGSSLWWEWLSCFHMKSHHCVAVDEKPCCNTPEVVCSWNCHARKGSEVKAEEWQKHCNYKKCQVWLMMFPQLWDSSSWLVPSQWGSLHNSKRWLLSSRTWTMRASSVLCRPIKTPRNCFCSVSLHLCRCRSRCHKLFHQLNFRRPLHSWKSSWWQTCWRSLLWNRSWPWPTLVRPLVALSAMSLAVLPLRCATMLMMVLVALNCSTMIQHSSCLLMSWHVTILTAVILASAGNVDGVVAFAVATRNAKDSTGSSTRMIALTFHHSWMGRKIATET